jgi:hypothetical protein
MNTAELKRIEEMDMELDILRAQRYQARRHLAIDRALGSAAQEQQSRVQLATVRAQITTHKQALEAAWTAVVRAADLPD